MPKNMKNKSGYLCRGNVMTPLNWFSCAFETVLIPVAATQHSNWLGIACFILAFLFAGSYLWIYRYILLNMPDRLQSEQYNLHQQEMSIERGDLSLPGGPRTIDAQSNPSLTDPSAPK